MVTNIPLLLPDISRQYIDDKSKFGGLGKFLTCWQAIYFCAQCVFRLSRQYSISPLELNVFVHALCALILFWIWWDKPQDVQEPTLITDNDELDLCASLCVKQGYKDDLWQLGISSEWIPCRPCSNAWEVATPAAVTLYPQRKSLGCPVTPAPVISLYDQQERLNLNKPLCLFGPFRQPCLRVLDNFWTIESWDLGGKICELDSRCIRRLARAYGYVKGYGSSLRSGRVTHRCVDFYWHDLKILSFLMKHTESYLLSPDDEQDGWPSQVRRSFFRAVAGLTLAGGCYGGLHLTAWTCQFPSHAETLLWRAASITIAMTGPCVLAYALCNGVVNRINSFVLRWLLAHDLSSARQAFLHLTTSTQRVFPWPWGLWYTFCRAFIVVECFIMLAHLPDTALEIPQWAAYAPHIT